MGRIDRPKSVLKTGQPAHKIILFEQDTSYYFQKGNYYHQKNNFSKALLFFRKAIELDPKNAVNHYNLACLLSKTNQLEEANRAFKHILKRLDPEMVECHFLMAVNYGILEDLDRARQSLLNYLEHSPEGDMAEEARELIYILEEESETATGPAEALSGRENEMIRRELATQNPALARKRLAEEPEFCRMLLWGFHQGGDELKYGIVAFLGKTAAPEAEALLREFAANPWLKERFRQSVLLTLKNMVPDAQCRIYREGHFVEVNLDSYPLAAPVWKLEWQKVLDCTIKNMRRNAHYEDDFFEDVHAIWIDYLNHVYPKVPRIIKPEAWGAALEYSLARFHFLNLTQKELAADYGVATSTVALKFKLINQALQIDQKAYRNMLAFLARQDREKD